MAEALVPEEALSVGVKPVKPKVPNGSRRIDSRGFVRGKERVDGNRRYRGRRQNQRPRIAQTTGQNPSQDDVVRTPQVAMNSELEVAVGIGSKSPAMYTMLVHHLLKIAGRNERGGDAGCIVAGDGEVTTGIGGRYM